jgi:hypothetical protein
MRCGCQAGALLATCAMELWPRATRVSQAAAAAGAAAGAAAAGAAIGGAALLCRLGGSCAPFHRF